MGGGCAGGYFVCVLLCVFVCFVCVVVCVLRACLCCFVFVVFLFRDGPDPRPVDSHFQEREEGNTQTQTHTFENYNVTKLGAS